MKNMITKLLIIFFTMITTISTASTAQAWESLVAAQIIKEECDGIKQVMKNVYTWKKKYGLNRMEALNTILKLTKMDGKVVDKEVRKLAKNVVFAAYAGTSSNAVYRACMDFDERFLLRRVFEEALSKERAKKRMKERMLVATQ